LPPRFGSPSSREATAAIDSNNICQKSIFQILTRTSSRADTMLAPGWGSSLPPQGWRTSPRESQAGSATPRGTPGPVDTSHVSSPRSLSTRSIPPSPVAGSPGHPSPRESPGVRTPSSGSGTSPAPLAPAMPRIRELNFGRSVAEGLSQALDGSSERRAVRGMGGCDPPRFPLSTKTHPRRLPCTGRGGR